MREIDHKATESLLELLDNDISIKCAQLKESHKQLKLKRLFLYSCIAIFLCFVLQIFFSLFNLSFLTMVLTYQLIALIIATLFIVNLNRGGLPGE